MPLFHDITEPDRRPLTITVASAGPGRYTASLDGRELCRSRLPFLDAARVLQAEGIAGDTPLGMLWVGSDRIALRSTVGAAAGLTVVENERLGPALAPYRPFDAARVGLPSHGSKSPAAGRVSPGPDVVRQLSEPSPDGPHEVPRRPRAGCPGGDPTHLPAPVQ